MRAMLSKIRTQLRDERGFMLAEQMISILFVGLLSVAVAAGLGVCIKVQRDISLESSSQVLMTRAIQEVNDQLQFSNDVQDDGLTFVSSTMHQQVRITSVDGEGIYLTQTDSSKTKTLLVGENSGLIAVFQTAPAYDSASNTWDYSIDVVDGSGKVIKSQDVSVKRAGSAATSD